MTFSFQYGTIADFSPYGSSEPSRTSQNARTAIKNAKPQALEALALGLQKPDAQELFADFFGPNITLVPAPRSSLLSADQLWPAKEICDELVRAKLGGQVLPCLVRTATVPKSHLQSSGNRPTVQQHYDTMEVQSSLLRPARILLVDDVISLGRTVFAGARRLQEAFPDADIKIFSPLRTRSRIPEIPSFRNLISSTIVESRNGNCIRNDPDDISV